MQIVQIVGLCLITVILVVLIREDRPEIALQMGIVVGIIVFLQMIDQILTVVDLLKDLFHKAKIEYLYVSIIFKVVGIAYIAEFGSQICKDAGSFSIAAKIEFAAKILIIVFSIPILINVMNLIIGILP